MRVAVGLLAAAVVAVPAAGAYRNPTPGRALLEDPSLKATVWSFIASHTR